MYFFASILLFGGFVAPIAVVTGGGQYLAIVTGVVAITWFGAPFGPQVSMRRSFPTLVLPRRRTSAPRAKQAIVTAAPKIMR